MLHTPTKPVGIFSHAFPNLGNMVGGFSHTLRNVKNMVGSFSHAFRNVENMVGGFSYPLKNKCATAVSRGAPLNIKSKGLS